jgi:hypothetical protein
MKYFRISSNLELERSVLEMIRVARRLIDLKKNDPSRAGIYKVTRQRLERLEKQVYKHRRKSQSKDVIDRIANEVAQLIGNLTKSLIRYLLSPYVQGASPIGCGYIRERSADIHNEYWINLEASENCFGP